MGHYEDLLGPDSPATKHNRLNYTQAIALLRDEKLVWSADMDAIRKALADVFEEHSSEDDFTFGTLNYLAEKLLEEENDLTVR